VPYQVVHHRIRACDRPRRAHHLLPCYVEMGTWNAIYGRPGAISLEMPDDLITGKCNEDKVVQVVRAPDPPRTVAPQGYIEEALNLLEKAERPLVLVSKGMACRAPKTSAPFSSARKSRSCVRRWARVWYPIIIRCRSRRRAPCAGLR